MQTDTCVLSVEGLCRYFDRGGERVHALDNVSFAIAKPEVVALAGPSGSGKSTLLNMLARFDQPDAGEIRIRGQALGQVGEQELNAFRNRELGFVFQSFNLIDVLSAEENVELALVPQMRSNSARRARAREALALVGMAHRLTHRPRQLSGGQQQRVAIARALVTQPTLVVADEPTGSLDQRTGEEVLDLIVRLNREINTSFVIATHDPKVMACATTVIQLCDGRRVL